MEMCGEKKTYELLVCCGINYQPHGSERSAPDFFSNLVLVDGFASFVYSEIGVESFFNEARSRVGETKLLACWAEAR